MELVFVCALLLAKLDRAHPQPQQVNMEQEEDGYDEGQEGCQDVSCHHEVGLFVVKRFGFLESASEDRVARSCNQIASERAVEDHVHEELVVVETDAVGNPWAVMVHLQDASIALGAVVASIRLSFVTPLADTDATQTPPLHRDP